jgi:HAMP domain-containing protein
MVLAAGLALHNGAYAQGAVYKCVDDQGRVEFTDTARRGCKALDLPGYTPPPAPRASAPIPAVRPMSPQQTAAAAATPANFPRVDNAQQRARDDDRREILNDELRAEQKKLADLRREFNNGEPERQGNERNYAKYQERVASMRDEIGRTERNIEALQREISNIR